MSFEKTSFSFPSLQASKPLTTATILAPVTALSFPLSSTRPVTAPQGLHCHPCNTLLGNPTWSHGFHNSLHGENCYIQLFQSRSLPSSTFLSPSNWSPSGASHSSRWQQAWRLSPLLKCHPPAHMASVSFHRLPSVICFSLHHSPRSSNSDVLIALTRLLSSLPLPRS